MAVTYQTEGIKMPEIKKRETTEWIKAVAASYGKRLGEIAYIFCSSAWIRYAPMQNNSALLMTMNSTVSLFTGYFIFAV